MVRDTPSDAGRTRVFEAVNEHLRSLREGLTEPVRIGEEALAEQLGVSRTPVREALIRLDSTGMVHLRPGRGALLMPVTDAEYVEWLQIREHLEGLATREAALNASGRDVELLRTIFAPFQPPAADHADDEAYAQANVAFHKEIMRLSGNGLLARIWESFGHRQTSARRQVIARLQRREQSLSDHLAIIEAIHRRDPDAAERLARAHVRAILDAVKQSLEPSHSLS
ncbi:GntR family transcriptional regulator [Achromobacter aloeverae]|uniref:GntR family transcriptional regulator n=1 Tax=Achromobacter aloeverae TaxID=1750518 RepID=A0A4Q1HN53_9BURK|nr:GntR family transcriptional regulator [Achromobacter aloeverae]RXN91640.1 GntR family transcriptional regulator [Achromobacter aloeverae]